MYLEDATHPGNYLGHFVQKRGRTTQLTQNGLITGVNLNHEADPTYGFPKHIVGHVFTVYPIDQNSFADPGDSGALIFDMQPGVAKGTFPVLGMLYAKQGDVVLCNDILAIFQQLALAPICAFVFQSLESTTGAKMSRIRKLRDEVISAFPIGKLLTDFIASEVVEITSLLLQDDETRGLFVETFSPWIKYEDHSDFLAAIIDETTVSNCGRLASRMEEQRPVLAEQSNQLFTLLHRARGLSVRHFLEGLPPTDANKEKCANGEHATS
jgi:hypothetical protein